jgi:uncharacterized Ntn-hydrolase superfamily protein
MTYSIVARDPETGELGVAVQSHWFSVGSVVTWAESGVGAVATQAFAEVSYGPLGLSLMGAGKTPRQSLDALLSADEASDRRQVAVVSADGTVAAHTGDRCIAEAGHRTGDGWSVQANMMLRDTVPDAMAEAYVSARGELAERLVAALDAAEEQGGDIRGRQSAAMLIVSGTPTGRQWEDRVLELRVEDHPAPLLELRRLVGLHRAYDRMNRGDEALATGEAGEAREHYEAAQEAVPGNAELTFWKGVMLAETGRVEQARAVLETVYPQPGEWRELLRRLPPAGLLPDDPELLERLGAGPE